MAPCKQQWQFLLKYGKCKKKEIVHPQKATRALQSFRSENILSDTIKK